LLLYLKKLDNFPVEAIDKGVADRHLPEENLRRLRSGLSVLNPI
jgi:hypothetical protein